jgi:uncharacterized membrane protein (GlpM family)
MPLWLKYLITTALVVFIAEAAKRSDRLGAFIGAMPWVTTLALIWLFVDKQGTEKIANHAWYTFWYVLPTLPMFLQLPFMLRRGYGFVPSLLVSALLTALCFWGTARMVRRWGIHLL